VLIWIVIGNPNPGSEDPHVQSVATHSQEFVGYAACEAARDMLIELAHKDSEETRKKLFANKDKPPRVRTQLAHIQ
jgi:hypothetical protein